MFQLPKIKKTFTDLLSPQEKSFNKTRFRVFLSTTIIGLGMLFSGPTNRGSEAPEVSSLQYVAVANRNRRDSIWKLILNPVSRFLENSAFAAHRSHSSHSSHRSHSSHSSHYSAQSAPSEPPATSPAPASPLTPGTPESSPATPRSPAGNPLRTAPATPQNSIITSRVIVRTIALSNDGSVLIGRENAAGQDLSFIWSEISRVKKANGSVGTLNQLKTGQNVAVQWIERDGKRMILEIIAP